MAFLNIDNKQDTGRSAYQTIMEKLRTPEKLNTNQVMAKIDDISQKNPERAQRLATDFRTLQSTPSSSLYNPYRTVTNRSVGNLSAMGIDTTNIDDNWFQKNSWLKDHLIFDGTTNTPTKPGKKATKEQLAAYDYYQVMKSEEQTRKAETEWNALQEEIGYWTGRTDRNYSDDEILAKIDWKKYPTLVAMDEAKGQGTSIELNRPVGYSKDAMSGVIWAARNGGGTGNNDADCANYARGVGNMWQENPQITARLDATSDQFAPYTVGSTMDEECAYFGVDHFDDKWIADNAWRLNSEDETERRFYANVVDNHEKTKKLNEERALMSKKIAKMAQWTTDESKIMKRLEEDPELSDLFALDRTMKNGKLVPTTGAVNYSRGIVADEIHGACENAKTNYRDFTTSVISDLSKTDENTRPMNPTNEMLLGLEEDVLTSGTEQKPPVSQTDIAIDQQEAKDYSDAGTAILDNGTEEEKTAFVSGKTASFIDMQTSLLGSMAKASHAGVRQLSGATMLAETPGKYMDVIRSVYPYESRQERLGQANEELAAIDQRLGEWNDFVPVSDSVWADIQNLDRTHNEDPDWAEAKATLTENPNDIHALSVIYGYTHGGTDFDPTNSQMVSDAKQTWEAYQMFGRSAIGAELRNQTDAATGKDWDQYNLGIRHEAGEGMVAIDDSEYETYTNLRDRKAELEGEISDLTTWLDDNREDYERASAERANLMNDWMYLDEQFGIGDVSRIETVVTMLPLAQQWVPTLHAPITIPEMYIGEDGDRSAAINYASQYAPLLRKQAAQFREILADPTYSGLFTDDERRNIERWADAADREAESCDYFLLDENEDFNTVASDTMGRVLNGDYADDPNSKWITAIATGTFPVDAEDATSVALGAMRGNGLDIYRTGRDNVTNQLLLDAMTEEEKSRYMYLLATQGSDAAEKYREFLMDDTYGVLPVRTSENVSNATREFASSGFLQSVAATGMAFITNIIGNTEGLLYSIGQKVAGKEYSEYSTKNLFSDATSGLRTGTKELYAGTPFEDLMNFVTDAVNTAGDSIISGYLSSELLGALGTAVQGSKWFKALTGVIDKAVNSGNPFISKAATFAVNTGKAFAPAMDNWLHAVPMSLGAGYQSKREAYMRGATPEQAEAMFWGTFFAESLSEAITFGNMREMVNAFKNGSGMTAGGAFKQVVSDILEEVFGETMNDRVGQILDRAIMKDASNYDTRVAELVASGMSTETAERQVDQEMGADLVRTAITTVLSTALHQGAAAGYGKAKTDYYKRHGASANPGDYLRSNAARENAVLTEAEGKDSTSQAIAVASTLDTGRGGLESAIARAAAQHLNEKIENVPQLVRNILRVGDDMVSLKTAVSMAALTEGQANNVLLELNGKLSLGEAITTEDTNRLIQAANVDRQDQNVMATFDSAVRENRIANKVNQKTAGNAKAFESAKKAEKDAWNNFVSAYEELEDMQDQVDAASESLQAAEKEYDPAKPETHASFQQAQNKLQGLVQQQADLETQANNANQKYDEAKKALGDIENEVLTPARIEAEQEVDQEDAVIAEVNRKQQEAAAKAQAERDEQSGKTWEQNRDSLIDKMLDEEYLEEGERREARREELTEQANRIKDGRIDMAGMMNNTEGMLAVGFLGRRLGVDVIKTTDPKIFAPGTKAAGKYVDGVVYLNGNMIDGKKMTIGQAVMEVALHEFTHSMELTKSYAKYSQTVMDFLFQGDDAESRMKAAIDDKIEKYKEEFGQTLTEDGARAEIVADFARTRLNNRDVVARFIDKGLAGKIRNTLHNINQAIKNFRLTGTERETAEYLRKTERLYQKMIEETARSAVHPDGGQFSIAQLAEAANLGFDENTLEMRTSDGTLIDGVNNRLTPEMLNGTPVGMLIDLAENGWKNNKGKNVLAATINRETAKAQRKMFADLANMAAQYRDSDLVWEIASSTLFSAMKSNSDPQYSTTVDFGTICAKTQEIINVMSRVMLEKGRGLTREEVLAVYNETANAGLTVPCPVCYVFSRWMGVPSLLGQMSNYQKRFVKTNADGSINIAKTQKAANDYIKSALEKYGDKEKIDDAKTSLLNRLKTQEKNRTEALKVITSETATEAEKEAAKVKHNNAISTMDSLTDELGEIEAFNWVTQALCKQHREGKKTVNDLDKNGNYIVDEAFQLTPDEVLFDLRRTGDFAKYAKNWSYRNTRGAGMGKAIMPYSGESIGDIVYGTNRRLASANPFLVLDPKTAAKGMKDAIVRAMRQNLIGGQRLQSTSDFRPEWGLDYLMTFLELQAIGSKVQMYTKVAEAVPLLASMGADINLSIMGKGKGWHIDENGNYVLDFSDVTGMKYETAKGLKDKYSNVQMILVGMNDTHIRLAMANTDIDFIIPWHSSGNSKDTLSSLISSASTGQEHLETSSDYTDTQSDAASENQTKDQKKLWDLRMKILQGKKINAEERAIIYADTYLRPLYDRFNVEGKDADCYKVKLGQDQAKQIFPYEYWDKSLRKEQANENGRRFVEYCQHFGIVPRFSGTVKTAAKGKYFTAEEVGDGKALAYDADGHVIRYEQNNFAGAIRDEDGNIIGYGEADDGYWKVLIDRPMYDNDGNYRDQQVVDATKAKVGRLENGKLVDSDMPLTTSAMYGPGYSEQEKTAVDKSLAAINEQEDLRGTRFSDGGASLTELGQSMPENESAKLSTLEKLTGKPLSNEMHEILSRLENDENIPLEDLYSVPEIDWARKQAREGFSIDTSVLEKYKKQKWSSTYVQDILSELPQDKVDSITRIKNELDSEGSIILNKEGKLVRGGEIKRGRRLDVILGLAAAGKSSIADYISLMYHSGFLDSDDAKKKIEGFDNGIGASYVHPESKFINEWREREAIERGDNIVLPVVGDGKIEKLSDRLYQYLDNGYDVHIHMVDLPQNKAIGRAIKRYINTGRYIDASILLGMNPSEIANNFEALKGRSDISGYAKWNNDVQYGEHPTVIESSGPEETGIFELPTGLRSESETDLPQGVQGNETGPGTWSDNGSRHSGLTEAGDNSTVIDDGAFSNGGASLTELDQSLVDAGVISQEDLDAYRLNQTQNPLEGENPEMATGYGPAQRQFGQGMLQESDEVSPQAKAYTAAMNAYFPDTNAEQVERAVKWIRSNKQTPNSDGFYESLQKVTGKDFDYRSADGQARMVAVMGMAVAKGNDGIMAQVALADAFNRQGTDLGRALQARKLFRMMTPAGRIASIQKMVDATADEIAQRTGTRPDLKFSEWIYQAAAVANNEGDYQKVMDAAQREIAEQIPANWKDKIRAFRMMSMLMNPRTHVRNVLGNAMFMAEVGMKNKLGAVGELITGQDERTKTLMPFLRAEARRFAREDAMAMRDELTGEAKYSERGKINQERRIFGTGDGIISKTGGRLIQALSDFNSKALEGEDWIFLKGHYRRALGGWMMANHYTAEQLRNDPKLLESGRAYAISEAQKATYRDFNKLASTLSDISRKGGPAGFFVDAVLPFRKTPANILRRGIEYSPMGILKAVTTDAVHLKQYLDYEKGKLDTLPSKAISPTEYIDRLCSGLSGTAIAALGFLLANAGVVTAGLGDDDDEFDKLRGDQQYALRAKIFGMDVSFTIDWAAPACMPFFLGAGLFDEMDKNGGSLNWESVESVANGLMAMSEPVFNLSMLDGVNTLFKTSQNSDTNMITQILAKVGTNYLTSFVPSVVGAIARTYDPIRRKAYVESGKGTGPAGTIRYAVEQTENKLPGVSESNIPIRDAFGNVSESSQGLRALENFLLPGYVSVKKNDPVIDELERIYNAENGLTQVIPKMPGKTISIDGQNVPLTAEEFDQLTAERGQTAHGLMEQVMATDYWKDLKPEDQAAIIEDIWTYATNTARHSVNGDYKMETWVVNAQSNPLQAIINRSEDYIEKKNVDGHVIDAFDALNAGDMNTVWDNIAWLEDHKSTGKLKTKLTNTYKAQYVTAYQDGDVTTMYEIEDTLIGTGLYTQKDLDKWITAADAQVEERDTQN